VSAPREAAARAGGTAPRPLPLARRALPHAPRPQPLPPLPPPQFRLRFPFRSAQQVAAGRAVGAGYLLTYLDADVLVGRAQAPGGSFVFVRSDDDAEEGGGGERGGGAAAEGAGRG
jgi:hypothetical protein